MTFTTAQVSDVLSYMTSKIGHGYSEALSGPDIRFGPTDYDCSGLVYDALKAAGINIPQSQAIASSEANWLGNQPGVQVVKSAKDIKAGDLLFFTGASPDPSNYGPIGHVGIASNSGQYVSAYDTAEGVVRNPISGDNFVVGMRLAGGTPTSNATPAPSGGSGGGTIEFPKEITGFFTDTQSFITSLMWIIHPQNWVRIVAFLAGIALLLFAIHALIAAGKGEPLISMPSTIPVPI